MGKGKLQKIAELDTFPNVFQNRNSNQVILENAKKKQVNYRGKWADKYFKNSHPLVLELACGKGDYAIGLGRLFKDINFIGIDIKGARIWRGAKTALEDSMNNVCFIRSQIDFLDQLFDVNEIDAIWITFPDPYPARSKVRKRLSSIPFLNRYRKVLKPGGIIHLKTDSDLLYRFTLESIKETNAQIVQQIDDIYALSMIPDILAIQTYYEKMHLKNGRLIHYVSFRFSEND